MQCRQRMFKFTKWEPEDMTQLLIINTLFMENIKLSFVSSWNVTITRTRHSFEIILCFSFTSHFISLRIISCPMNKTAVFSKGSSHFGSTAEKETQVVQFIWDPLFPFWHWYDWVIPYRLYWCSSRNMALVMSDYYKCKLCIKFEIIRIRADVRA